MSEHEQLSALWTGANDEVPKGCASLLGVDPPRTIGGHASAAIAELHPHMRPIDVYRKLTDPPADEPTDEMQWGSMIETIILAWAESRVLGGTVESRSKRRSTKYPQLHSCPDGHFAGSTTIAPGLVEAKSVGGYRSRFWGSSKTDRIPDYASIQQQLYMGIEGEMWCYVVAAIGGKPPELWAVPYEPRAFDAIVSMDLAFFRLHVEPRIPPPADGSAAYKRWISETLKMRKPELIAVAEASEMHEVAMEFRAKHLALKTIEAEHEVAKQKLQLAIGEHAGLQLPGDEGAVTYRANKNGVRSLLVPRSWKGKGEE